MDNIIIFSKLFESIHYLRRVESLQWRLVHSRFIITNSGLYLFSKHSLKTEFPSQFKQIAATLVSHSAAFLEQPTAEYTMLKFVNALNILRSKYGVDKEKTSSAWSTAPTFSLGCRNISYFHLTPYMRMNEKRREEERAREATNTSVRH